MKSKYKRRVKRRQDGNRLEVEFGDEVILVILLQDYYLAETPANNYLLKIPSQINLKYLESLSYSGDYQYLLGTDDVMTFQPVIYFYTLHFSNISQKNSPEKNLLSNRIVLYKIRHTPEDFNYLQ